jgi:hypothetical protein
MTAVLGELSGIKTGVSSRRLTCWRQARMLDG